MSADVRGSRSAYPTGGPPSLAGARGVGPGPTPRRTVAGRLQNIPDCAVALGAGALAAGICVLPWWQAPSFYYSFLIADQYEEFAPFWHVFGQELRAGRWTPMDPAAWAGGNYAGEALTGIWNPVSLANDVLASFSGDLARAAAVIMVEALALLATATFLLAREYGAGRSPAVLVAVAVPVSGFPLWYEAAGWSAGLWAFTWVAHFWWSARRLARGRLNPLVPFLFGCLAMTTGEPYAALGLVAVLAALALELLHERQFARLAHLVVMGACVGAVALLVYLPLLATDPVSDRREIAELVNDTSFVPDLRDVAAGSAPTYLPAIPYWNGPFQPVPVAYLAWFVVPLLPWLRWAALWRRRRTWSSAAVLAAGYLLAMLAPSSVWMFRRPLRVIEYCYLAVAVLFAVALSCGLAADHRRRRAAVTAGLVLVETYLAWAVRPVGLNHVHLYGFLLLAGLTALALAAGTWRGTAALVLVAVVGTAAVVTFQAAVFPPRGPGEELVDPPSDLVRLAAGASTFRGAVFQVATLDGVTAEQLRDGELLFGNLWRAAGVPSLTSYSGIGFRAFSEQLCSNYRGGTCPQALDRLWMPAGESVPAPLVDVLRVSTVVIQRSMRPDAADAPPPPGWEVALRDDARTVWVRERPLPEGGRVSWSSPGTEILSDTAAPDHEVVRFRGDGPGRLVLARLAWPGYTATVDGRSTPVATGPAGLVSLDVPAGTHALVLDYTPPGLRPGAVAAAAAVLLVTAQTALWTWQRRRTPGIGPATGTATVTAVDRRARKTGRVSLPPPTPGPT